MQVSMELVNSKGFIHNNKKTYKNNFVHQPSENIQKNNFAILQTPSFFNINFKGYNYCKTITTITKENYQKFVKKICDSTEPQEFKNFIDESRVHGTAFQSFIVWLYNKHNDFIKDKIFSLKDLEDLRTELTINSQDDNNNTLLKLFNANAKAYFIEQISEYKNHEIKKILINYDEYERDENIDCSLTDILKGINPYNISEKINIVNIARQHPDFLNDESHNIELKKALSDDSLAYFEDCIKYAEDKKQEENEFLGSDLAVNKGEVNKTSNSQKSNVSFADIGGQNEAIEQLKRNIVRPCLYPEFYRKNDIVPEKGVILYGPPGTGKSLIASALEKETGGCYYRSINATEMESKWLGETELQWRNLFKKLKEHQPSILFVDEADALCKKRGSSDVHGDKELNQFLQLVSDYKNLDIYIILATNNIKAFDDAITRSKRFGTKIEMLPPKTAEDVKTIFNIHTKNTKLADEVKQNTDMISEKLLAKNVTGADIAFIISMAQDEALERLNIFDKMDSCTLTDEDTDSFILSLCDITKAINKFDKPTYKRVSFGE